MDLYISRTLHKAPTNDEPSRSSALAAWHETPPPWGGEWRSFFSSFSRCVELQQPGVTVTDLYGCTAGETTSTVPQVREALQAAMEAGLVLRILDERPDGTREYYGLNPDSWLLSKIMERPCEIRPPATNDEAIQAVRRFSELSFTDLAVACGFDGSSLTPTRVLSFFCSGPYHLTEIYMSPRLYPDGVSSFYFPVRTFIDAIVQQGVSSGVLRESNDEHGRELYSVAPGIAELLPPSAVEHHDPR